MKKQFFIITTIIAFLTILSVTNIAAQTGRRVSVEVEFDFHVGKTLYPAGKYFLESISPTNDNVLRISDPKMSKNQMIIGNMLDAGSWQRPKLVFKRYGENYFLSQIFLEGGRWGFSFAPSRKQREYLASAKTVEVALVR